jgi:hypothetical protein
MVQRDFNKLANIQTAMDTLRMYNNFVLFPASEEILQNPALEVYFNSPLDSPVERKIEKMICVAAIRSVYENPNIPKMNKERAARATARDLRAAMQKGKIEFRAAAGELTVPEYNRRNRSNIIVKRAAKVKMAKSLLKNISITALAGAVAGPIGASVAVGTRILWRFLPDKIKQPIVKNIEQVKEGAYTILKNTATKVKNTYEVFKSTSVGQKVEAAVQAVKPIVTKAKEAVVKVTKKVWDYAKSWWPF